MIQNTKKARPAGDAAGQAEAGNALQGSFPDSDCTTNPPRKQGLIESLLPTGEQNAIRASDLAHLAGVKSNRELRNMISRERAAGALILSTCRNGGGYFLPSGGEAGRREMEAFVATLRTRALNTLRAVKAARSALERVEGQIALDERSATGANENIR